MRNKTVSVSTGTTQAFEKAALFAGRRILDALNKQPLEKAHASLMQGREKKHCRRLGEQVERLRAGKPAFMDRPALKKAAVFFYKMLRPTGLRGVVDRKLANRSQKIFSEVSPFILGDNVLDLGCGDGKVGELVAQQLGKTVTLCDIFDYTKTRLPLVVYDGNKLPFRNKEFNCTLLSVVLHHSNDPFTVLDEAFRVTSERVVVIESVFFNALHKLFNAVLDWVYNRVLNSPEINVPFNFLRPAGWVQEFEKRGGRVIHMEHLGLDIPLVPEWHVLYVVDVSLGRSG